jgi:hypothetical protein
MGKGFENVGSIAEMVPGCPKFLRQTGPICLVGSPGRPSERYPTALKLRNSVFATEPSGAKRLAYRR